MPEFTRSSIKPIGEGINRVSRYLRPGCTLCNSCCGRGNNNPLIEGASPSEGVGCHIYKEFKSQAWTAKGLWLMMAQVLNANYPITEELEKLYFYCNDCAACSEVCGPLQNAGPVNLTDLWLAMREEIVRKRGKVPNSLSIVNQRVRKYYNPFGGRNEVRAKWAAQLNLPSTGENVYFASCYDSFRSSKVAKSVVKILRSAGMEVAYLGPEEHCSGFTPRWSGDVSTFAELARHNVEKMKQAGAKRIIFTCPGAMKLWKKDYPDLIGELPFEVVHISELLVQLIEQGKIKFTTRIDRKVTFHDPCYLGRHSQIFEAPRRILRSIPGIELVEMERHGRWSYCCGDGIGTTSNYDFEYAKRLGVDRLNEAKKFADVVITSCPHCNSHMKKVSGDQKMTLELTDLPILVAQAMGLN